MGTVLPSLVCAAVPFNFETAPGRLPKNVVPIDYTVAIAPNLKTQVINGTESVILEFKEATSTIVSNSLNQHVTQVLGIVSTGAL